MPDGVTRHSVLCVTAKRLKREVSIRRIAEGAVADAASVVDTKNALTSWHSQTKAEADVNLKRSVDVNGRQAHHRSTASLHHSFSAPLESNQKRRSLHPSPNSVRF